MTVPTLKSEVPASPQWSDDNIYTQLWRYKNFSANEKQETREKVQAVSNYLFPLGLYLKGAPADGNCFFHSFLRSYAEKQKKNQFLDNQHNRIKYLRTKVAQLVKNEDQKRAKTIKEDRIWIASNEGGKIATILGFPIRVITANLIQKAVRIEDVVYKVDGTFQDWKSVSPKPSVQKTPIIVDLGRHFIWASTTPPVVDFPKLFTSPFVVWYQQKRKNFYLDGTEKNFREVLKEIARQNKIDFKDRNSQDDAYSSDDDFVEEQSDYKPYVWRDDSPPTASRTTISCIDGNMKGNEILALCRSYISKFLKHISEESVDPTKLPGRYFAANAGKFAKFKTSLDCDKQFSPGKYFFGLSEVKLELHEDERLYIADEKLKDWITKDLGLTIKRWDLPYRGYNDVVGIKEIIEKINVLDNKLGTIQLYCAFPLSYGLSELYAEILGQGALHKFLDFLNALIFGIEGSRNNLVFLTGFLVLLNMREASYPTGKAQKKQKGDYFYIDLFDLFPMAVTGTGSGNFVAEKAMYLATEQLEKNRHLLSERRPLGFSSFRENPAWLKVTLKSAILIYNWLGESLQFTLTAETPKSRCLEQLEISSTDSPNTKEKKINHNSTVSNNCEESIEEWLEEEVLTRYYADNDNDSLDTVDDSDSYDSEASDNESSSD